MGTSLTNKLALHSDAQDKITDSSRPDELKAAIERLGSDVKKQQQTLAKLRSQVNRISRSTSSNAGIQRPTISAVPSLRLVK